MIQSIKVDVIYYSIGSDFEMEFNLCGCCRMRLLTDKVYTQSDFSKSLARSVKRSKVIILCGPLFGEKGLIRTVSKVTGIETELLDKSAYELEDAADVNILKGSTALVTDDGIFGGCIIESNTQSIILLSESKSLRKNIMKQLIYPYITKLSIMPDEDAVSSDVADTDDTISPEIIDDEITVNEDIDSQQSEPIDEQTDDTENSFENGVNEPNSDDDTIESEDFIIDISNSNVAQTASDPAEQADLYDSALIFDLPSKDNNMSVEEKNQKYYLFEDEGEEEFNDDSKVNIAIKIIIAFIVAIALLIGYIAIIKPIIMHKDIPTYLREIFSSKLYVDIFKIF